MKVFTIGAGFSGLLMAHKFQHRFPEMRDIVEHTVFEARSEVGGTWFINNYPGVQCDVPAHIYAFPFDPNPNWSRFYASGPEILEYIKSTVRKWNLDRDLQLNTRVIGAQWQEAKGQWKVTVEHEGKQREEHCHVLISAQGVLVHESWPDIPGLRDFEGHITHSALWDHNYDYSNRKVAVIGNGSSGIQIVPQMQKLPGTDVVNFIRGQAWVYYRAPPSKHLGRDDPDPNPKYTDAEREMFQDPDYHLQHRKGIISRTNKSFHIFMKGKNNEEGMKLAAAQMAEKLGHDSKLCDMLIPKWELGCRRITPGPGYLESFLQPNCNVTNSPITNISKKGVHTADGKLYECDVTIPDYPNYFMMMGPNCLGGHGSLVESLNWTGDYFIKWIKKMATEDIKYVEPKQEVVDAFIRFMGNGFTAWEMDTKNDLSWYVEKADKVPDACAS
ncbi:putative sterigmatocystin biosynthesis monooxygenase stcW [Colletotrichum sp. SAR11_240]|nr:putative sterigmatocystin biosynthesis monooxygenase stcW [Colletotrichum sp. SAR11_240]